MQSRSFLPYAVAGAAGAMVATCLPLIVSSSRADTKLLPFQGRLTDASGAAISDGAKVVEFKMYDAPTGGNSKWAGEIHKLSVNAGLVNTMLGSKASLGSVDFSTPTFLQITVDANNDGQITAADPPLLPRQSVVPTLYAAVAGEIQYNVGGAFASVRGSDLLDASGKLKAGSIAANDGITAAQLATAAIGSDEIGDEAVTLSKLSPEVLFSLGGTGSVDSVKLKDGEVQTVDIADGAVTSVKILEGTIQSEDIGLQAIRPDRLSREFAIFSQSENASTGGGNAVEGWNKRKLNTDEYASPGFTALNTNGTISLPPGTYWVRAVSTAWGTSRGQTVIRDAASASPDDALLRGTPFVCSYAGGGTAATALSEVEGVIEVPTAGRLIELWQYCGAITNIHAMGAPTDIGPTPLPQRNIFARMVIQKIR